MRLDGSGSVSHKERVEGAVLVAIDCRLLIGLWDTKTYKYSVRYEI